MDRKKEILSKSVFSTHPQQKAGQVHLGTSAIGYLVNNRGRVLEYQRIGTHHSNIIFRTLVVFSHFRDWIEALIKKFSDMDIGNIVPNESLSAM